MKWQRPILRIFGEFYQSIRACRLGQKTIPKGMLPSALENPILTASPSVCYVLKEHRPMSVEQIGLIFQKASERLDENWKKMREHFVKLSKQLQDRRERNPEVLGNRTDAAIKLAREKEVELTPIPTETLTRAVTQQELDNRWQKV